MCGTPRFRFALKAEEGVFAEVGLLELSSTDWDRGEPGDSRAIVGGVTLGEGSFELEVLESPLALKVEI